MDGLVVIILIGAVVAAVVTRRRLRDPESPLGRWYRQRIKPRQKVITTWFFFGTLLLWAALFTLATPEDRENSTRALKTFGDGFRPPAEGKNVVPKQ